MIHRKYLCSAALALLFSLAIFAAPASAQKPPVVKSPRLYVFDCGVLNIPDTDRYNLKREELATHLMSCSAFLIVHPKGTLMWDTGVVADSEFPSDGGPGKLQYATATKKLLPQLAAAGYTPMDITYLAFSHFHWDHVGNGNAFAASTWLVRQKERDIMFAEPPSDRTIPAHFSALKNSKTIIVKDDEYDVFGDGSVIMKSAPGHSPDHQVLLVKLKKTGPVLLSGDLWHYPEERKLNRFPKTEFDVEQTKASREKIEAYLQKTHAQLWIQHDYMGNRRLKKAPAFYE
jgi:glyoxylase-like metal-dependent hydrolase (beta-lactamase superfamily II)